MWCVTSHVVLFADSGADERVHIQRRALHPGPDVDRRMRPPVSVREHQPQHLPMQPAVGAIFRCCFTLLQQRVVVVVSSEKERMC